VVLVYQGGPEREAGLELLALIRERALSERFSMAPLPVVDVCTARSKAAMGDFDGAIECSRAAVEYVFRSGALVWLALTISALVESLLGRGSDADMREARAAIDRLAALPTDPGFVLNEIWLLRLEALLARALGDEAGYRHHWFRYRARATELGFEGHIKWAAALPA
jgi:adenylate cyclase